MSDEKSKHLLDEYMTAAEAAAELRIGRRTLDRYIAERVLPVTYLGRRPLIPRQGVLKMLQARTRQVVK
jgi:excisionase family DNA binding protein